MNILRTSGNKILRTAAGKLLYRNVITDVNNGLLYNWPAVTDSRGIAPIGFHLPTYDDMFILRDNWGSTVADAEALSLANPLYWVNTADMTNSSNFNAKGSGVRNYSTGVFEYIREKLNIWHGSEVYYPNMPSFLQISSIMYNPANSSGYGNYTYSKLGASTRLIKDDSTDTGRMTGNDGKVYRTVKIGNQVWLADNLSETRFRNGDIIPWYGANPANYFTNAEWAALTGPGCAAYANVPSNVAAGFSFPA